jgi:hypothetical protein
MIYRRHTFKAWLFLIFIINSSYNLRNTSPDLKKEEAFILQDNKNSIPAVL